MLDEYNLCKTKLGHLSTVNCKPVACKWVFKLKTQSNQSVRYKARLVANGFAQRLGVDYSETFSLVSKMETIRCLLIPAHQLNWK